MSVLACGALAACGGDDGGGDDGGTASVEDFCESMERVSVQLDSRGFFETIDGNDVAPALEAVQSIDPPEEISSEWAAVLDGSERAAELEANDERVDGTAEAEEGADRILSYVEVQCSVDLFS